MYHDCFDSEKDFTIEDHRQKWENRIGADDSTCASSEWHETSSCVSLDYNSDVSDCPPTLVGSDSSDEEDQNGSEQESDSDDEQLSVPYLPASFVRVRRNKKYIKIVAAPGTTLVPGKSNLKKNYKSLFGFQGIPKINSKHVEIDFLNSETILVPSYSEKTDAWIKPITSHIPGFKWSDEIRNLNKSIEIEKAHIRAIALHECIELENEGGEWLTSPPVGARRRMVRAMEPSQAEQTTT